MSHVCNIVEMTLTVLSELKEEYQVSIWLLTLNSFGYWQYEWRPKTLMEGLRLLSILCQTDP